MPRRSPFQSLSCTLAALPAPSPAPARLGHKARLFGACGSASSTTASIRTRSAGRALVPESAGTPGRRRPRGRLPDAAPVAGGRGRGRPRRAGHRGRAAAWRSTGAAAADGSRRRSASARRPRAPREARRSLRRRPHGRRFRTSRCSRRRCCGRFAATGSSSTGTRSGRATTGASTSADRRERSAGASSSCACAFPQRAFCFSRLHERRLREEGFRGELTVLRGPVRGPAGAARSGRRPADGRLRRSAHPREAGASARPGDRPRPRADPGPPVRDLRRRPRPRRGAPPRRAARASRRWSTSPDSCRRERIEQALASALCLVLPSRREGYGLVVVEAASTGTPSVVVADPDNAAVEFIEDGVNGFVATSAAARDLAEAIVRAAEAGPAGRQLTYEWFERNRDSFSLAASVATVADAYSDIPDNPGIR